MSEWSGAGERYWVCDVCGKRTDISGDGNMPSDFLFVNIGKGFVEDMQETYHFCSIEHLNQWMLKPDRENKP